MQLAERCGITALNMVIRGLGEMQHAHTAERMLGLMMSADLYNEHTAAMAFQAFHKSGRFKLCLTTFEQACRQASSTAQSPAGGHTAHLNLCTYRERQAVGAVGKQLLTCPRGPYNTTAPAMPASSRGQRVGVWGGGGVHRRPRHRRPRLVVHACSPDLPKSRN